MFRKYWNFITGFITLDVKERNESQDAAMLIRIISLDYIAYFLISSLLMTFLYKYVVAIFCLIFVASSLMCFIFTYEGLNKIGYYTLIGTLVASSCTLAITLGWRCHYQWSIIVAIILTYYSTTLDRQVKMRLTQVFITIMSALAIFSAFYGSIPTSRRGVLIAMDILAALLYSTSLAFISYYFNKKFNSTEESLRQANEDLLKMATIDPLTQLYNRRSMNEYLSTLAYEHARKNDNFAIAIADIDFFKKVNDNYGHDSGDYILQSVSDIFRKAIEGRGRVARWGGEEFLFTFENMTADQAYKILDNIRTSIENTPFYYKNNKLNITITAGLEDYSEINGIEATISKADDKLYEGKNTGRNKVVK